ncbi:DNA replication/repair protein RecF [Thiothrix fructosivorans]|uniref:DNA replication and repair protein RecF n=1 Tax=Thiothrix fructosivorans TaxID=111770 RepID=A0A8B0SIP3_9GAMM|nr:DNA replication and repair protein RecF [Thiothrix fructosivorans]MBO0612458.1 DNA replication and repair protein RecF [Thiothrix fructosivorans]QTX12063.1 DNA replication and repair protein RecF [Thiothrix fructosivorans]
MWISRLNVQHCRVIHSTALALSAHANVLYGDNASGKSSLLEALAVLSRGRSFRTPRIAEVITRGENELTVAASVEQGIILQSYPLGITKSAAETRIRINHADVQQQAELSTHVPLTLIHPGSVELLTGSPTARRAFLDWIAFYRFAEFNRAWRDYQRVLKQRNACLRDSKQRQALPQWTRQLIALQPILWRYRMDALTALQTVLQDCAELLSAVSYPQLVLSSGFPVGINPQDESQIAQFLSEKTEQECKQGFTLYGAHRADLHILLEGVPALRIASRGQLKVLAVALLLAQSHAIADNATKRGIIAIDDLASELDEQNQQALYNTLRTTQQQLIITGTHHQPLKNWVADAQAFQVKHGQVFAAN